MQIEQVTLTVSSVSSRLGSMETMAMIALERDAALATAGGRAQLLSQNSPKNPSLGLSLDAFDNDDAKIPTKNIN